MAGSGGALNLSLLSRGVGEVTKNGHEKIEVLFEPQDYYNFVDSHRRIYLPPIDPQYAFDSAPTFSSRRRKPQVLIPKTFTTRKGALLLFSEDMAHRTRDTHAVRRHHHHDPSRILEEESSLSQSVDESDLRTVEDLTKSILSYGQDGDEAPGYLNLKLMSKRKRDYFDRQIRPGFSAKRYLSSWTKCWDDSVLEKVISKGYLTEKSLFYYNPLMPHLQRRLNDDMSHYPVPYKLMRSMLVSPGSLSGYTFYRVRPESAESITTPEVEMVQGMSQQTSIKVISTKDGIQREVTYASLDKKAKEEVLTDLLVKSAVHYAMKKQQEYIEDSYTKTIEPRKIKEVSEESSLPQFDMKDAVDSLLDTHKSKAALLDADIPDDKSQLSDHSGSFKGKAKRSKKPRGKDKTGDISPGRREYVAGAAVISLQESPSPSSVPQLPQIPGQLAPLPPIGEASREQSKVPLTLPPIARDDAGVPLVNIQPPTPQHTTLFGSGAKEPGLETYLESETEDDEWAPREQEDARQRAMEVDRQRRDELKHRKKKLGEGPMVAGGSYLQSSSESIASVHSVPPSKPQRTHFKGSNQSLRSFGSKRGAGSTEESSNKGSVVLGPDGEVISLGGKIQFTPRQDAPHIEQVVSANQIEQNAAQIGKDLISDDSDAEEPDEWKHSKPLRKGDSMRNFANRREIDYTSGDIDATQSISSWSYMPRDTDQEFEGLNKASSVHSLPGLPLKPENYPRTKDLTILSRATEKTDEECIGNANAPPGGEVGTTFSPQLPTLESTELNTPEIGSMVPTGTMHLSSNVTSVTPLKSISAYDTTPGILQPQIREGTDEEVKVIETRGEGQTDSKQEVSGNVSHSGSESGGPGFVSQVTVLPGKKSLTEEISESTFQESTEPENVTEKISFPEVNKESPPPETTLPKEDEIPQDITHIEDEVSEERKEVEQSMEQETEPQPEDAQEVSEPPKTPTAKEKVPDGTTGKVTLSRKPSRLSNAPSVIEEPKEESGAESARESLPSQISEQDIVDALTEHAQQIASDILKKDETGQDLTEDARRAAEMWMSKFPPGRRLSRSQSIQELPDTSVMESVMKSHKRKSAGPTYAEYRELIKESLATAISNASGEELPEDFIAQDAEISKELIDALASGSLSPDDIEIVQDEESGKSVIRSKSQMSQAMGGVKAGHIYVPVANNGNKAASSIPAERASVVDIGAFDVIKYGTAETASKAGSDHTHDEKSVSEKAPSEKTPSEKGSSVKGKSQPPSIMGESIIEENEVQTVVSEGKKSSVTFKDEKEQPEEEQPVDEFQEAVEKVQQQVEEEKVDQKSEVSKKSEAKEEQEAAKTPKSAKSLASQKSEDKKSKVSEQSAVKSKTPEKKEEFVVGKVKQKNELEQLYGQVEPPAPKVPTPPAEVKKPLPAAKEDVKKPDAVAKKPEPIAKKQEIKAKASVQKPAEEKPPEPPVPEASNVDYKGELEKLFGKLPTGKDKGKPKDKPKGKAAAKKPVKGKGKKAAKKKEEVEKVAEPPPPKEPTPPPPKEPTPPPPPPPEPKPDAESDRESADESYKSEEEDDFEFNIVRDSPSPEPAGPPSVIESSTHSAVDDTTEAEEDYDEDDEAARLRMISNREARAAKRAAQAEKRKKEVERRRREREEQSKREKEESERQEMLRRELEEERRRNEENRRRRREMQEEEREREEREQVEKERQRLLEIEREKKRKEEYQRKLEELKRKQLEEEKRRHEEQLQREKEEEERRKEEEEMMAKMAEEERLEYERKKKIEEEERKRKEEEDRKRREEEAQKAMEEARRLAEEMARKQAELEARLQFNRTIQVESSGLTHSQNINPAFVFSYFELLSWLGLDIPEFELMKLNQY